MFEAMCPTHHLPPADCTLPLDSRVLETVLTDEVSSLALEHSSVCPEDPQTDRTLGHLRQPAVELSHGLAHHRPHHLNVAGGGDAGGVYVGNL